MPPSLVMCSCMSNLLHGGEMAISPEGMAAMPFTHQKR